MRRMKKGTKIFLTLLVLGGLAYGAFHFIAGTQSEDDELLIFNRYWMSKVPETETDYFYDFFILVQANRGAFAKMSHYRFEEEIFEYERSGQTLEVLFPQTDRRQAIRYEITRCDDYPPYGLCLDLSKNPWGGPTRYYSYAENQGSVENRSEIETQRSKSSPWSFEH